MSRRRSNDGPDGLAVIDKDAGWTSHDVVAKSRGLLGTRKVGHSGTLDPDATGLLLLGVGRVTRLLRFLTALPKTYTCEIVRGAETSTLDDSGEVTATHDMSGVSFADVEAAAIGLTGDIMQVPPIYSAIKIAGERAYDLARAGNAPVMEARPARVDRFELIDRPDADHAVFEVQSGKGVYMRSLARDIARACGTVGHIAALRRLRVGPFTEAQAIPLDKLQRADDTPPVSPDFLLPVATALADIPALALTEAEAFGLSHGQAISLVDLMGRIPRTADPDNGVVRAMAGNRVLGLCRLSDGMLKPERLL